MSSRMIQKVDPRGALPGCLVLQKGQYTLEEWLSHAPDIARNSKWEILNSIAAALEELHGLGVVHCNVSPKNLAFFPSEQKWKLLNLDCASRVNDLQKLRATDVAYAAPEVLQVTQDASLSLWHRPAVDMWSYGMIAYEILTGRRFYGDTIAYRSVLLGFLSSSKFVEELNSVRDRRQRHFIKKFLNVISSKRQTAAVARRNAILNTTSGDTPVAAPRTNTS